MEGILETWVEWLKALDMETIGRRGLWKERQSRDKLLHQCLGRILGFVDGEEEQRES